jgi:hypothetical protein
MEKQHDIGKFRKTLETGKRIAKKIGPGKIAATLGVIGITVGIGGCIQDHYSNNATNRSNLIEETQLLQEKGLMGDHPLIDLREVPGFDFNGQVSGGLLFIEGAIDGKTTQYIEFAWKTKEDDPRIIISKVPVENVQFTVIKDDPSVDAIKSTVLFTGMKPDAFVIKEVDHSNKKGSILDSGNPNDYVNKIADQLTIITMSQSSWDSFRRAINTGSQAK